MCRVTGGSGKCLPQQERHGEAPRRQEEARRRGELRPANVQEQLQACWGRCQWGEGPGLVTESGEGQPAHCVTLGKGPRLPGASFYPQMHRHD